MTHQTISQSILKFLAESGESAINVFLFPHPRTRIARALLGMNHRPRTSRATAQRSLSSMLSYLKRQGLVARRGSKKKTLWKITALGRQFLDRDPALHQLKTIDDLPPEDGIARLVTFDVPEKYRAGRVWLRTTLIMCDFQPLQRSVFLGWRPLPEDILRELDLRKMNRFIHIISIEKTGTLPRKQKVL